MPFTRRTGLDRAVQTHVGPHALALGLEALSGIDDDLGELVIERFEQVSLRGSDQNTLFVNGLRLDRGEVEGASAQGIA